MQNPQPAMNSAQLQNWLIQRIANLKNIDPKKINSKQKFSDLAINSINSYEISGEIESMTGKTVPEEALLADKTIKKFVEDILHGNGQQQSYSDRVNNITESKKEKDDGNFSLDELLKNSDALPLRQRAALIKQLPAQLLDSRYYLMREVLTPADREVTILDPFTQKTKKMLMFGSNNYLGLANHPYVQAQVKKVLQEFGSGIGGPPLLNGYTRLHRELEERLAALKHAESAVVFPNGYGTNLGVVNGLVGKQDLIIYDEYSHASFIDGIKLWHGNAMMFAHNNMMALENLLQQCQGKYRNIFIGVEGAYSMEGDIAPLAEIVKLCEKYQAILIIDDAHGTGIMGDHGAGAAEHCHVSDKVDINMGTFSKALAQVGGFIAADRDIVEYLRFNARSYIFSASLPPTVVAAVLACLDVIRDEPELRTRLYDNVKYAAEKIKAAGINCHKPESGIIALLLPAHVDIVKMRYAFHQQGLFVNTIEYPAVPKDKQRLRLSFMANHTRADIDKLVTTIAQVWNNSYE